VERMGAKGGGFCVASPGHKGNGVFTKKTGLAIEKGLESVRDNIRREERKNYGRACSKE